MICLFCSHQLKYTGRHNPNCRYPRLDDQFFARIDSEAKAYLLGWIASDGSVRADGTVNLAVHEKDRAILARLRSLLCPDLPLYRKGNLIGLRFCSQQMVHDICGWLDIEPGKKSHTVALPQLVSPELTWAFVRGLFDGDGSIVSRGGSRTSPYCSLASSSDRMRDALRAFCRVPCAESGTNLAWSGNNALDFLARLYDPAAAGLFLERKREAYEDWSLWVPALGGPKNGGHTDLLFRWSRTDRRAVPPFKERASDSGYDLTLIERVNSSGERVELYTTGIRIQPEYGWYFDLVPRSSLTKSGYMMVNGVGVIDRTYKGPILVALIKVDDQAPNLVLPCRLVQIIPRPIIHVRWREVETLDATERGANGFGSTGER